MKKRRAGCGPLAGNIRLPVRNMRYFCSFITRSIAFARLAKTFRSRFK
ncbi:hypothetical protein KCP71_10145 [Salmonella enterica subsp. enterica]|nr:hypothetical protein KCP71_10145 [Salmonella enterica subsp. enterica]